MYRQASFADARVVYQDTGTSHAVSYQPVGTYYYRVKATHSGRDSGWSAVRSVVVTVPPPPCEVTCEANANGWQAHITCESGSASSRTESFQYWDDNRGWVTHYEIDRTFADSGNTYHITAEHWRVSSGGNIVGRVWVNVTGGVFGENTQHCQNY